MENDDYLKTLMDRFFFFFSSIIDEENIKNRLYTNKLLINRIFINTFFKKINEETKNKNIDEFMQKFNIKENHKSEIEKYYNLFIEYKNLHN